MNSARSARTAREPCRRGCPDPCTTSSRGTPLPPGGGDRGDRERLDRDVRDDRVRAGHLPGDRPPARHGERPLAGPQVARRHDRIRRRVLAAPAACEHADLAALRLEQLADGLHELLDAAGVGHHEARDEQDAHPCIFPGRSTACEPGIDRVRVRAWASRRRPARFRRRGSPLVGHERPLDAPALRGRAATRVLADGAHRRPAHGDGARALAPAAEDVHGDGEPRAGRAAGRPGHRERRDVRAPAGDDPAAADLAGRPRTRRGSSCPGRPRTRSRTR